MAYYEVLQVVQTKIRFYDCNGKIIFVSDEICAKMPQKPKYEWQKNSNFGRKWGNFKIEAQKSS